MFAALTEIACFKHAKRVAANEALLHYDRAAHKKTARTLRPSG